MFATLYCIYDLLIGLVRLIHAYTQEKERKGNKLTITAKFLASSPPIVLVDVTLSVEMLQELLLQDAELLGIG
ncbi:MAG: hypothetical protein M3298_03295 [Thermoproteota archaeon]|nr:hypothetical protein [Thermoproteota archaeon]MDQ3807174.1 hypothetical protein [Thermoproteota archaeon]